MASFERNASLQQAAAMQQGTASQLRAATRCSAPRKTHFALPSFWFSSVAACATQGSRVSTAQLSLGSSAAAARLHGPLQRDLQLLQLIDRGVDVGLGSALLLRSEDAHGVSNLSPRVAPTHTGPVPAIQRRASDKERARAVDGP